MPKRVFLAVVVFLLAAAALEVGFAVLNGVEVSTRVAKYTVEVIAGAVAASYFWESTQRRRTPERVDAPPTKALTSV